MGTYHALSCFEQVTLQQQNGRTAGSLKASEKALSDLSFECFGGIGVKAPSINTYNSTFATLTQIRAVITKVEAA